MNYNSYCNAASIIVFPCVIKACDYLDSVLFELTREHAIQDISDDILRLKIISDNMDYVISDTCHSLNQITNASYDLPDCLNYLKKYSKDSSDKNVFERIEQNWKFIHRRPTKEAVEKYRRKSPEHLLPHETELSGYTIDCYKTIRSATEICQLLDNERNDCTDKVFGWFAIRTAIFFPICV